jgi:2'-5' RNA ligase
MRLFVAVHVPDALQELLESDVVARLRPALPSARWTRREGRHLTLKFLGEVPEQRVAALAEAVGNAVRRHRGFSAAFARVGAFPSLRRPRVLWIGLGEGDAPMAALARDVDEAVEPFGFEREKRPFAAHLTLARFKVPAPVGSLPAVAVPSSPFVVDEVVLFRSQLRRDGAIYTAVARFPLAA